MTAPKMPLRSAEEIAREMVVDAGWLQLGPNGVRLASDVSVPHARVIIASAIEQARADGASAERERLRDASPIALRKPAEVRVGQVWRRIETLVDGAAHPGRDLEVVRIDNGIAKLGVDGAVWCETKYMLTLDAWIFIRETRDLTGRIRALVHAWTDRWIESQREAFRTHDRFEIARARACGLVVTHLSRQCARETVDLRMFDALAADDSVAVDVYASAADDLERILREHEAQR